MVIRDKTHGRTHPRHEFPHAPRPRANIGTKLKLGLEKAGSHRDWSHITSQIGKSPLRGFIDNIGMFCYSGLTPEQVSQLRYKHHVYLTKDGRISMAGVNSSNVDYIAKAIVDVTESK
jgi:aspartate aminotransferase, mitochondrial